MHETPKKELNISLTQNLTPVRFLDSPRGKSSANESNYAVCKTRLELLINTLQDNFAKWKLAQQRGLALCRSIEAIKTKHLQDKADTLYYPPELKTYCNKLSTISSIFSDIAKSASECLSQLQALNKLPGVANEIFYRTWRLTQFIDFVQQLIECYEPEAQIKQKVMRELPHCSARTELIYCTSAWEYPQHADDYITVLFTFLAQEINLNKQ